ncbi:DUF3558 domain-containing protein [Actinophytocola glycyrrhizae]|uniref:DUF3558 domain-containing protein n=1 Tax=Actinophytocola glycyrrhizae TaxID=2044873 RepID=A0ABV9SD41_9PSEU
MRRSFLAASAALVVLLSGCSEPTEGNPTAGGDTGGETTADRTIGTDPDAPTDSSQPPTSGGDDPSGLADLDPCGLVDQAGLTSLGLTGGEEKTLGEARVCRYRHDGPTLNESFTVSVELFDTRGLDDIVGSNVQQLPKIGAHDAASFVGPTGSCGVSLAVGDSARVDNTAVGGAQQQGCELAARLAALVEPNLP